MTPELAVLIARPSDRTRALKRYLVAPVILLAAWLAPLPRDGKIAGMPSLCTFHNLTGLPCPGCGFTRSLVCCAHFHWRDAMFFHPLGPLLYVILIVWSVVGVIRIVFPCAATPDHSSASAVWLIRIASTVILALLIGVWLARLFCEIPSPP